MNKDLIEISKRLDDIDDKIQNLTSKIEELKEFRHTYIKSKIDTIKSNWPSKEKFYVLKKRKLEYISTPDCYGIKHDDSAYYCDFRKWGSLKWNRCVCNDDILYFKPKSRFEYKKSQSFEDYYYFIIYGDVYDKDGIKINTKTHEAIIDDLIESDFIPDVHNTPKQKPVNKLTYVYLMKDNNTGYYKIGRSDNPVIRERTLQSQKPTIEMILNWKTFASTEKELHREFFDKRIRGEWFDLDEIDINFIKELSDAKI